MSQPSWRSTGLAAVLFGLPLECSRFGTEMRLIASTNREVRMPREAGCRESISPSRIRTPTLAQSRGVRDIHFAALVQRYAVCGRRSRA